MIALLRRTTLAFIGPMKQGLVQASRPVPVAAPYRERLHRRRHRRDAGAELLENCRRSSRIILAFRGRLNGFDAEIGNQPRKGRKGRPQRHPVTAGGADVRAVDPSLRPEGAFAAGPVVPHSRNGRNVRPRLDHRDLVLRSFPFATAQCGKTGLHRRDPRMVAVAAPQADRR